jgi:hypothetical protein|tara:strand:- start:20673 stop:20852 length:180 start_codon:yes stop_codon:yes gene_type:complete
MKLEIYEAVWIGEYPEGRVYHPGETVDLADTELANSHIAAGYALAAGGKKATPKAEATD